MHGVSATSRRYIGTNRLAAVVLLAAVTLMAFSVSGAAQATSVSIATNPSGSLFYAIAAGIAATVSEHSSIAVDVIPYGGSTAFLPLVNEGVEVDFGTSNAVDTGLAFRGPGFQIGGRNPFEPAPDLRLAVPVGAFTAGFFVRADSDIRTVADLRGRRVAGGYPAQLAVWFDGLALLTGCGMSWDDVRVVSVPGVNEGLDALIDGRVDAAAGAVGAAKLEEAEASVGVRMISACSGEDVERRLQEQVPGYYPHLVPAGSGPGNREDAWGVNKDVYFVTSAGLDNGTVYGVVKTLWENVDSLRSRHAHFRNLSTDQFARPNASIPYHDGAIEFYREAGAWGSAQEANQQRVLGEMYQGR